MVAYTRKTRIVMTAGVHERWAYSAPLVALTMSFANTVVSRLFPTKQIKSYKNVPKIKIWNGCLTTPQHKNKSAIGFQINGMYIKS